MLSYSEYISKAWETFKIQPGLYCGISVLNLLVSFLASLSGGWAFVIGGLISLNSLYCFRLLYLGQVIKPNDIFWTFGSIPRFIQATLLTVFCGLGIFIGFLFLVIPGIWLYVNWSLAQILFIKNEKVAIATMKDSTRLVQPHWWWFAKLIFYCSVINFVGVLFFGVGLVVSISITTLIWLLVAEDIKELNKETSESQSPSNVVLQEGSYITINPKASE